VVTREQSVKAGDIVLVPWGLEEPVHARVLELWGNPPSQVRVQLLLGTEDEQLILLLPPSLLTPAA
jgi:hypothetical protein